MGSHKTDKREKKIETQVTKVKIYVKIIFKCPCSKRDFGVETRDNTKNSCTTRCWTRPFSGDGLKVSCDWAYFH